jgi:hypothetical protein
LITLQFFVALSMHAPRNHWHLTSATQVAWTATVEHSAEATSEVNAVAARTAAAKMDENLIFVYCLFHRNNG